MRLMTALFASDPEIANNFAPPIPRVPADHQEVQFRTKSG
jgi:hypothetical protein